MNNSDSSNNACIKKFEWHKKLTAIANLFVDKMCVCVRACCVRVSACVVCACVSV